MGLKVFYLYPVSEKYSVTVTVCHRSKIVQLQFFVNCITVICLILKTFSYTLCTR